MPADKPTHWPGPVDMRNLWTRRWDEAKRQNVSERNETLWQAMKFGLLGGEVAAAEQFRKDAEADGWIFAATYQHEPIDRAFTGAKGGFKIQGLARGGDDGSLPTGQINIWGPDGISISPVPIAYPGFEAIRALARYCPECKGENVDTVRVAFANRCCLQCAPGLRKKLERPGWCD